MPERSLGRVVVHRDVRVGDVAEGPQRVVFLQESGAVVRGLLIVAAGAVLKQRLDRGAQRRELLAQPVEIVVVLEVGVVDVDRLARGPQQLSPELAGRARPFGERDQRPDPVRPAQLLLEHIEPVIADVAVGDHEPAELLAQQLLRRLLGTVRVDPVARRQRGAGDPQALIGAVQPPASLIGMHLLGLLNRGAQLLPRVLQDRRHARDHRVDRAERDRHPEHLDDHFLHLPAREPIHAGQRCDMRLQSWRERRPGHPPPGDPPASACRSTGTATGPGRTETPAGAPAEAPTADGPPNPQPASRCRQTRARTRTPQGDARCDDRPARAAPTRGACPHAPAAHPPCAAPGSSV
jgi:hypothetical protein